VIRFSQIAGSGVCAGILTLLIPAAAGVQAQQIDAGPAAPDAGIVADGLTRSWDGTTGTMERTFTGPNGQTRSFQHAWAPDEPPVQQMQRLRRDRWAGRGDAVGPPAESEAPGKWGWLEKLNPFRKRSGPAFGAVASRPSPPRRAGFTVGSAGRGGMSRMPHGLANRSPGQPSPKSHRPPWAGTPRLRQSPVHSGMTKLRANSGRGGNR
jgi:hypothetical protein